MTKLSPISTAEKNRLYAKARKARKQAQRERAAAMPSKEVLQRITPANEYEREIAREVQAAFISPVLAMHRFLKERNAGGYSILRGSFEIDGAELIDSEVDELTELLASILRSNFKRGGDELIDSEIDELAELLASILIDDLISLNGEGAQ